MKANHTSSLSFCHHKRKTKKKDLYGQKPQQALKPYRSNHY